MNYRSIMKNFFTAGILLCFIFQDVFSQNIINNSYSKQRILLRTGIDPSLNIAITYQRNLKLKFLNNEITSYGEWKASVVRFGVQNWDMNIGGIIPIYKKNNFLIINDLYGSLGKLKTKNFDAWGILLGDRINIGFYTEKHYFALLAEYNKNLLTHLLHTDFYRRTFYEDADDGWYKSTGGFFQFGFAGGWTMRKKYDLYIELKYPITEKFDSFGGSPFNINLGLGFRF